MKELHPHQVYPLVRQHCRSYRYSLLRVEYPPPWEFQQSDYLQYSPDFGDFSRLERASTTPVWMLHPPIDGIVFAIYCTYSKLIDTKT